MGEAQFYLLNTKDKDGHALDGSKMCKVNVPGNVPVKQYWSITVYDRATHAFIRNLDRQGRSSQSPGFQKNGDGSVDIYFAPKPPAARKPTAPTDPAGKFELMARFYGIEQVFFKKEWQLNDVEGGEISGVLK